MLIISNLINNMKKDIENNIDENFQKIQKALEYAHHEMLLTSFFIAQTQFLNEEYDEELEKSK